MVIKFILGLTSDEPSFLCIADYTDKNEWVEDRTWTSNFQVKMWLVLKWNENFQYLHLDGCDQFVDRLWFQLNKV